MGIELHGIGPPVRDVFKDRVKKVEDELAESGSGKGTIPLFAIKGTIEGKP
jgi:hypothetical protein